jgi:formylglycine-generating enzyme required for sulfatase activity
MLGKRTLVKLDVKGYGDLARIIESATDAKSISTLNQKIQGFVEDSLQSVGPNTGYVIKNEGDSALVQFEHADEAHKFSVAVHQLTARENIGRPKQSEIIFRIGCATGEIDLETHAGNVNTIAFRLEPKAQPGGILIDLQMYNELSLEAQKQYDTEEIIEGKRDEIFYARRWLGNSKLTLAQSKNQNDSGIITRILDVPQISNSFAYSFEAITLNSKAEIVRREPRTSQYLVESIGDQELRMLIIPGGEYGMGSIDRKAPACEKPQHPVKVSAFVMSQYPITKAQWKIVATWPMVNRQLKIVPSRKGVANLPVVNASWYDAVEFCDRLSQRTGHSYRLPTEAEWEYACRAGSNTPFHFGETITGQYANYDATIKYYSEPKGVYRKQITPIDKFKFPNHFGLFDMHGNVWEWCLDYWHDSYEPVSSDGQAWSDHTKPIMVVRGGSWNCEPRLCRSNHRFSNNQADNLSNDIGFRVIRLLSKPS